MPKTEYVATGRRKTAVARLRMQVGEGKFFVNNTPFEKYFNLHSIKHYIVEPLRVCDAFGKFDIKVNVKGGGTSGQAGAIRLAISRALVKYAHELRGRLKPLGLLTRDARIVERKKYGLAGARRAYQFSKR